VKALQRTSGLEGRQWHDAEMVGLVGVLRGPDLGARTKPVDRSHRGMSAATMQQSEAVAVQRGDRPGVSKKGV
jgi:hypothetical protein